MPRTRRRRLVAVRVLLGIAVLAVLAQAGYHLLIRAAYPCRYAEAVESAAAEFDLPPSLIYAVIRTESHFQVTAVSAAGAKGLMQLTDSTFRWVWCKLEDGDPPEQAVFDPQINIRVGCKLLSLLSREFSETDTVLAAYNAGIGRVRTWLADPACSPDGKTLSRIPIGETAAYTKRVTHARSVYQTVYELP